MTRNRPLFKSENGVKIYAPTSPTGRGKYFRIVYPYNGGFKDTTAVTETLAKQEAARIARQIKNGGEMRFRSSGSDFLDAYLNPDIRELSGRAWGPKHALSQKYLLSKYVRPVIGEIRCCDITNDQLKAIVRSGKTISKGQHISASLHGLIKWGHSERWITESPDELLKGLSNTVTKMKGLKQSIESGENAMFVNLSEIPTHGDVAAVAAAAAEVSGIWWYELLFNLAAYSGMRIGEIFDLDVTQINTEAKTIRITSQCLEVGGKKSRALPKFGKQRTTIYPRITPSGYPLAEEVKRRVAEIQEVEDAPTLLDGTSRRLLFHNPRGSWISQSWFASRIRRPAQEKAGWPKSGDQYRWTFHSLRHVFCSYYLGDLKQSPQDVAIVAGHSDAFTTISMYVGASREAIDKLSSAN